MAQEGPVPLTWPLTSRHSGLSPDQARTQGWQPCLEGCLNPGWLATWGRASGPHPCPWRTLKPGAHALQRRPVPTPLACWDRTGGTKFWREQGRVDAEELKLHGRLSSEPALDVEIALACGLAPTEPEPRDTPFWASGLSATRQPRGGLDGPGQSYRLPHPGRVHCAQHTSDTAPWCDFSTGSRTGQAPWSLPTPP